MQGWGKTHGSINVLLFSPSSEDCTVLCRYGQQPTRELQVCWKKGIPTLFCPPPGCLSSLTLIPSPTPASLPVCSVCVDTVKYLQCAWLEMTIIDSTCKPKHCMKEMLTTSSTCFVGPLLMHASFYFKC